MSIQGSRAEFKSVKHHAYLAHCAISPMPKSVVEAMRAMLSHFQQHGVYQYDKIASQMDDLKSDLSTLFGGAPTDYSFVPNTSFGINQIAHSISWKTGDRILVLENEFPTNVRPWLYSAECNGLETVQLPVSQDSTRSALDLDALESLLKEGVRLMAVSAVQFQTGKRMPLDEIYTLCQQYNTLLFVDAIQACGALPFEGCSYDFWVSGGHKWMLGPEGSGFLYTHPRIRPHLKPKFQGWLSVENPLNFLFNGAGLLDYGRPLSPTGTRFELGTHNRIGCAGLFAAVKLIMQVTPKATFERAQDYHDLAEPLFVKHGFTSTRSSNPYERSCILGLYPPEGLSPEILVPHFSQFGVVLTVPDGCLRIAPHYWNRTEEIGRLAEALDALPVLN